MSEKGKYNLSKFHFDVRSLLVQTMSVNDEVMNSSIKEKKRFDKFLENSASLLLDLNELVYEKIEEFAEEI